MENVSAYGAGLTGGAFDLNAFLKKPTVFFRILALVSGVDSWTSARRPFDSLFRPCFEEKKKRF